MIICFKHKINNSMCVCNKILEFDLDELMVEEELRQNGIFKAEPLTKEKEQLAIQTYSKEDIHSACEWYIGNYTVPSTPEITKQWIKYRKEHNDFSYAFWLLKKAFSGVYNE